MKKIFVILMLISVCFSSFLFGKLSKNGTVIDYQWFDSGLKPKEYKEFFAKYKEKLQTVVGKDKKLFSGEIASAFDNKIKPEKFEEFNEIYKNTYQWNIDAPIILIGSIIFVNPKHWELKVEVEQVLKGKKVLKKYYNNNIPKNITVSVLPKHGIPTKELKSISLPNGLLQTIPNDNSSFKIEKSKQMKYLFYCDIQFSSYKNTQKPVFSGLGEYKYFKLYNLDNKLKYNIDKYFDKVDDGKKAPYTIRISKKHQKYLHRVYLEISDLIRDLEKLRSISYGKDFYKIFDKK